jgi:hypothetical protein
MESSDDRGHGWRGRLVEEIRKLGDRPDTERLVEEIGKLRDRPDTERLVEEIRKLDDLKPNE